MRKLLCLVLTMGLLTAARAEDQPTYERDIKPLLIKKCVGCHNVGKQSDLDVSAGLALDSYEAIIAGTEAHKVVHPGKAVQSELYRRLSAQVEAERMPLNSPPLTTDQSDLVKRWIDAGTPRGTPSTTTVTKRRIIRSLMVTIPIETKAKIDEAEGPVSLKLPIGPLPGISSLAFRGDGRELAVGSYGQVTLWDLADGRPSLTLADLPGPVHALAYSRDGRRLVLGMGLPARSGVIRIYAVPDGTLVHQLDGHGDVVVGLAIRPDGCQLASASFDQTVRFWSLVDGTAQGVFQGHSDFVHDLCFARDGKSVISVSKDRTVKRIDASTFKELRTYSDHNESVLAIAIRPDGQGFVTAGDESALRWWGFEEERPGRRTSGHGGPVQQLAFSADGSRLISASGDKSVRLWDGKSGIAQRTLTGPTEWQYAAALSGNGKLAAAGGWDGIVRVWQADKGSLLGMLIQPPRASEADPMPEWLAILSDGHLDGSASLLGVTEWAVGGKPISRESALKHFQKNVDLYQE